MRRRGFETHLNSFYIGAYWGPRTDSVGQATVAVLRLLRELPDPELLFSTWYQLGRSLQEAKEHVFLPTEDSVRQLLLRGQNRRDIDRRSIAELGFSLTLWNGRVGHGATNLSVLIGATAEHVSNRCVLSVQQEPTSPLDMSSVPTLKQIMTVLVETLNPHRAIVSNPLLDEALEEAGVHTKVGWLTYLADDVLQEESLKATYKTTSLGASGSLVILEPIDIFGESPEDLSRVVAFGRLVQAANSAAARRA